MSLVSCYRHVSFDLDGTLVHTLSEYRHTIVPVVVAQLGGVVKDASYVDRFWFGSGRDATIEEGFGLSANVFWETFRERDRPENRALHTHAYPEVEHVLRILKGQGKITSIITGAPHWIAEMEIKKLNGAPYDYYLSIFGEGYKEKPDPASFLYVMSELRAKPEETVYIGNADEDALFAMKAGVDFIYLERKEHPFSLGDYTVATIHSLAALVE